MKKETKQIYWMAQIFGWGSYTLVSYVANILEKGNDLKPYFFVFVLFFASVGILLTHLMREILIQKNWLNLPILKLLPRIGMVIALFSFILVQVESVFNIITEGKKWNTLIYQFDDRHFYLNIIGAFLLLILWNIIYFAYHFFYKSYLRELENLKLESSKNEIELKNLRSQINPHFLFNSLNSIRALIEIDPTQAKKTVTKLSNLLRTSLLFGKKDKIMIEEELGLVSNYLDLEKVRFEDRIQAEFKVQEDLRTTYIPPLIVQTMVENAIKHGLSKEINGGKLIVEIFKLDKKLYLRVQNTGHLDPNHKPDTGIGIENTRRRLTLLYKDHANFNLYEQNGMVCSEIIIEKEDE